MEQPNFIEAKGAGKSEENKTSPSQQEALVGEGAHAEAVAFVERHRDFFEHYAKGRIKIEPAPEGLKTFAFNLETNTIYVNSMFYNKLHLSDEKTIFGTLHEIEHFMEKLLILSEPRTRKELSGEEKLENYLKRINESRAYSLMDNCVADIRENRAVSSLNEAMVDLQEKIYEEDLFPETDLTGEPCHIQFCEAILRENEVRGKKCTVSPEVRQALDEVTKVSGLIDTMTSPKTPMSFRWKLQDKYLWPIVEKFRKKDEEDKKKQKDKDDKSQKGKKGESGDKGEGGDESKKSESNKKAENGRKDNKAAKKEEGGQEKEETDPNKIFADDYDKAEKRVPNAVPIEEIEKAFKEWKEIQRGKDTADKADEDYAKKIGVEKKDLQDYRKTVESLEKLVNPETHVGVLEKLRNLFSRIISKRIKQVQAPKYPMAEGDELVDPAQLVADVKSGNLEPKVWEDTEVREKRGDRFGEVEITLVCDRSSSMEQGDKAVEQRKSAVLVMEVLKEFADMCDEERIKVDKPLEIRSEVYTFASSGEDKIPLKKMSKDLGEAERILVLKKLHDLPGSTTDFNCLEAINNGLSEETKKKIKEGELKKIVVVFTDGGSDNPIEVQANLNDLRKNGVVVIGVGMTEAGKPVETTYAPKALVVEDVTKLPIVLADLLKEHLKDL